MSDVNWEKAYEFMEERYNRVNQTVDGYPFEVSLLNFPPRVEIKIFIVSEDARRAEEILPLEGNYPAIVKYPTEDELYMASSQLGEMTKRLDKVKIKRDWYQQGMVYVIKPKLGYGQFGA